MSTISATPRLVPITKYPNRHSHCWYCGTRIFDMRGCGTVPSGDGFYDLEPPVRCLRHQTDHQTPRSRGGSNSSDNLVDCCKTCNSQKGASTLEEYRTWLGVTSFFGEVTRG
jgi:5-methylcytosine-specific restriction endonuclease McrA